ncbi:hypothetical protein ACRE_016030 [Hapsidospora chrysogenum ATCC 11550]|uniref:F-box domain-containing protein n=1 Tax=Hapsidospora chrysogenum (strain ATCC 11550 / CBS 779.69 / DSM 880 / IAM 14645 / JCM 23072 / IMI 49137) TaxID=857340 RepID=A0A086TDX0_HAPC1|nr:hypothetical protein ACRE_016030 [Hapsidospora chrysogenum ATCC 11550]
MVPPILLLPWELWLVILDHLDVFDIFELGLCSKELNERLKEYLCVNCEARQRLLLRACFNGDIVRIQEAIDYGADVSTATSYRPTFKHLLSPGNTCDRACRKIAFNMIVSTLFVTGRMGKWPAFEWLLRHDARLDQVPGRYGGQGVEFQRVFFNPWNPGPVLLFEHYKRRDQIRNYERLVDQALVLAVEFHRPNEVIECWLRLGASPERVVRLGRHNDPKKAMSLVSKDAGDTRLELFMEWGFGLGRLPPRETPWVEVPGIDLAQQELEGVELRPLVKEICAPDLTEDGDGSALEDSADPESVASAPLFHRLCTPPLTQDVEDG